MNSVVLYAEWNSLINSFDFIDQRGTLSFFNSIILANYSSNDRYYHNYNHINSMLFYLRFFEKKLNVTDLMAVKFAIIFHDLVYNVDSKDNERKSAEFASSFINSYIQDEELAYKVKTMILLTKDHFKDVVITHDEKVLLDLDLSIFASDERDYDQYVKNIMLEYKDVSRDKYLDGRIGFLTNLIDKKIFRTEFFSNFENQAQNNIIRELDFLND
jgi:predicted metal-dependent HD superfamily phosphohydrolase